MKIECYLRDKIALSLFFINNATLVTVTMCVPEVYWKDCVDMIKDSALKGIPISCISGRDRYECIEKVGNKEADVVAVDPEDMYLTAKKNQMATKAGYNLVEQVRRFELFHFYKFFFHLTLL